MIVQNIYVFRKRNLPFRDIGEAKVQVVTDWSEIEKMAFYAAFICTPTSFHLEQTTFCAEKNIPCLVEKPLSHNLKQIDTLKKIVIENGSLIQVGYMMRFHPFIKKIKQWKEQDQYGNLISIKSYWGSYLPDWHPYESYKTSYAALQSLGGGAALTLSHDIDLAIWIAESDVTAFESKFTYNTHLDIETEAVADIVLHFNRNCEAIIHLNFLDQPPQRRYEFQFETAVVTFNYFENSLIVADPVSKEIFLEFYYPEFDRNDLFKEEIIDFFRRIETKGSRPDQYPHRRAVGRPPG